jgi:phage shock protein C
MTAKTRQQSATQSIDSFMDIDERKLHQTMEEFLEEEEREETNIWNFATIAGLAMFFVGMLYVIQLIGLSWGPDLSGFINALPLIGGVLVTLVGFGYFVGDRKKVKQAQKEKKRKQKRAKEYDFNFDKEEKKDFTLDNDLGEKKSQKGYSEEKYRFDRYAFRQSKKLYKSRSDKKLAGVCGGLAKYFGISSTVVRLLFVITLFAGSGMSFLIYIALAIVLDKEPPEMDSQFDF